ncbi:MAG: hypothetical protein NDJ72_09415, partial [Elusimicrobia bacterium]|nr:hypothetical protein [Elusimicrobiota bacterium]
MLGFHLGGAGQLFGNGGKDFDTLDGIDAEIALQIHIGIDGFGRISRLFGDDGQQNRQDFGRRRVIGNADDGRGQRRGRGRRDAFGQIYRDLLQRPQSAEMFG